MYGTIRQSAYLVLAHFLREKASLGLKWLKAQTGKV